ncbi:MAG: hypothetical protein FE78DRAFT_178920 [Acidomyces sp. 'richmondensis']|nr:MAG: hypothetical protein FE78DRAFT_178920 [Acidomyces sp. 'richmondensis']
MADWTYQRTLEHIKALAGDPDLPPDHRIFDEAEMVLPVYFASNKGRHEDLEILMRTIAANLTDSRRADHAAAVNLLIKLFDGWTWQQVCDFGTQSIPYKDGLADGDAMVPFNRLMIALLSKATQSPSDAEHAASMHETMQALVRLWLCTNDMGVASECAELLLNLLKVDIGAPVGGGGLGLVWKRIFSDRDVYNVFFSSTSLFVADGRSKAQKTIAQSRLLDWLPHVATLNWGAVANVHHADIENAYGSNGGLLSYVSTKMVDVKDDLLMHRCLIDFYSNLLRAQPPEDVCSGTQYSSMALQYLTEHNLHTRTIAIYLQLPEAQTDAFETPFLYGSAANYVATYASVYPDHFIGSEMRLLIMKRLHTTLNRRPAYWSQQDSPKHDLHVLASLPRMSLLPNRDGNGPFSGTPVSYLPCRATNADVLNTLATIFKGPPPNRVRPGSSNHLDGVFRQRNQEEAAAARALYFHYLASNPGFWENVVSHADTIAILDCALAAINLIHSVITANWSILRPSLDLPQMNFATPEVGCISILSPPAMQHIMPYLIRPPRTFANLVGGRGDTESAAYKVALAKYDALNALSTCLQAEVEKSPEDGFDGILATIRKRLATGPFSREGEVGGSIGTLES